MAEVERFRATVNSAPSLGICAFQPILDPEGEWVRFSSYEQVVEDRKEAEREVERAEDERDAAEQRIQQLEGALRELTDAFDVMEDARSGQRGWGGARRFAKAQDQLDDAMFKARSALAEKAGE